MKKIILALLMILVFLPLASSAQESKSVDYCFTIENLDDYPDYRLLWFSDGPTYDYQLIDEQNNHCLKSKKHSRPLVLAVEKDGFSEEDFAQAFSSFKKSDKFTVEERDDLIESIKKRAFKISPDDASFFNPYNLEISLSDFYNDEQAIKDFAIEYLVNEDFYAFFEEQGFILSDFRFDSQLSIAYRPGADKVFDKARIEKLNQEGLQIRMLETEFTFSDGSTEKSDYRLIKPEPEAKLNILDYWYVGVLILLALAAIIINVYKSRQSHGRDEDR